MIPVEAYEALRPRLFAVAYRMLGSASEAEDVVQDAWLRAADRLDRAREPRAYLTTVVTRLCLDRLKSARARREEYVGPWLPEPVPTGDLLDPEERAERLDSISFAFLLLLETLTPSERAAFLLREVFGYEYRELAETLEASEAACRQWVHRAKARLADGRPRFRAAPERRVEIVGRFLAAARDGDLAGLERLLADDARFVSDGGGKAVAARRVVEGAVAIARAFAGFGRAAARPGAPEATFSLEELNGESALLIREEGRLTTAILFTLLGERIEAVRAVRNPEKLAWLERRLAGA